MQGAELYIKGSYTIQQIIQGIGLIIALCFVIFGIDDLIWDISSIIRNIRSGEPARLPFEQLDAIPPKLLAVMIAAWHEENVIEAVIDNMISSLQYSRAMYHVFIGVYPNDEPTVEVVRKLTQKYENVHIVINMRPGPTCKADNVNNIIRYIKEFEQKYQWRFSSVTIHDAEDVVHPYELKLTNYLLDTYNVLQFPVIPLQKMPVLKNIFKSMTIGTYGDEFAENHYRTMSSREANSAIVPSAGTGFVISHKILDTYGNEPIFPEDTLTEDYKLSLILAKKGFNTHFVLEKVPRLMDNHTVRWDYVATRSFFPDTFAAAVRQKTRWIYGITMQSVKLSEMFKASKLGLAGRYSLYKDFKAKYSNMIILPGYLVFIYFLMSLFTSLPYMYPRNSFSYLLCVVITFMMVFRQIMRAVAISNFYGFKSMAVACLLPPVMPIRLVWGNIINMTATYKAWKLFFKGTGTKRKKKKVAWNKTDHTFLEKHVLYRYSRNIGDVLLEKQYIDVSTLSIALRHSKNQGLRIGEFLLQKGFISEKQLVEAVANVQHKIFVKDISLFASNLTASFDMELLQKLLAFPLLRTKTGYVFAITEFSAIDKICMALGLEMEHHNYVYATKTSIMEAIRRKRYVASMAYKVVSKNLETGRITWEQAVIALDNHNSVPDALAYMGLEGISEGEAAVSLMS